MEKRVWEKAATLLTTAWISDRLGLLFPSIILLFVLMAADYISGMLADKKESLEHLFDKNYGWSSKKSLVGIYKKVGYIFIILVSVVSDYLIYNLANEIGINFPTNTMFGLLVVAWLIVNELLSILENAGWMGGEMPEILKKILAELKKI